MGFKCGIVGLPNVGKSTLFNALTETASAEAANYPFCTIEPNTGIVSVPDKRLIELSNLAKSQKIIPAQMQFVDIEINYDKIIDNTEENKKFINPTNDWKSIYDNKKY